MDGDLEELLGLGQLLDVAAANLNGETAGVFLAETLLKVRTRAGAFAPLKPNRAQREFERCRGRANVVLKARQMGISTWVAGRFFLKTVTQPGTLSLQVAHTQEAAEEIFRVVRRFHNELPEALREGVLRTSRANARSLVFPELDSEYRVETAGDPECGARANGAEPALLRGCALAGRCAVDAGRATGDDAGGGRRGSAGVDRAGRAWMLLRRVDARRGEWLGAAFLSLVVGGELLARCG